MSETKQKIDVHHHLTPKAYVDALASIGITESYGQAFPEWTPEKSLKFMKKYGIMTAIVSISTPGVTLQDVSFSRDLARMCNETVAGLKKDYPGKFGGFAAIPLLNTKDAIEEVSFSLDELGLDGVGLFTHYNGRYLGHQAFEVLFQELNRRKAIVFIHPTDPLGQYDPELEIANSLIEAKFETTRAVTNLIITGTIDRYPDIKYILPHGGGTIPYLAWSIALAKYAGAESKPSVLRLVYDILIQGSPEAGLNILRNMYYDTALSTSPWMLNTMQEFTGSSQIVFGSDLPFSEKVAPMMAKGFEEYTGFSESDRQAIEYANCLELFPQLNRNGNSS